jgi:hypothetical protein
VSREYRDEAEVFGGLRLGATEIIGLSGGYEIAMSSERSGNVRL